MSGITLFYSQLSQHKESNHNATLKTITKETHLRNA